LRKMSCRMAFPYQTRPTSQSLSCTIFGVNKTLLKSPTNLTKPRPRGVKRGVNEFWVVAGRNG
jgi:hypothetical protein